MNRWYVAKCKPQKESWLTTSLSIHDVEVYVPRVVKRKRGRQVLEPLFPTYVFCRLDPSRSDWPAIRWSSGLSYFLGSDGRPSYVPDELVNHIKERVEEWNVGTHPGRTLKTGDDVLVNNGPFAGLDGVFNRYVSPKRRCQILLQVVGRMTPVEVEEKDLALKVGVL